MKSAPNAAVLTPEAAAFEHNHTSRNTPCDSRLFLKPGHQPPQSSCDFYAPKSLLGAVRITIWYCRTMTVPSRACGRLLFTLTPGRMPRDQPWQRHRVV